MVNIELEKINNLVSGEEMEFSRREVRDFRDKTAFVLVSLPHGPFSPSSKPRRADLVLRSRYSELCFHCYIFSSE